MIDKIIAIKVMQHSLRWIKMFKEFKKISELRIFLVVSGYALGSFLLEIRASRSQILDVKSQISLLWPKLSKSNFVCQVFSTFSVLVVFLATSSP